MSDKNIETDHPPFAVGEEVFTNFFSPGSPGYSWRAEDGVRRDGVEVRVMHVERDARCESGWRIHTEAKACPSCGSPAYYSLHADAGWFWKILEPAPFQPLPRGRQQEQE